MFLNLTFVEKAGRPKAAPKSAKSAAVVDDSPMEDPPTPVKETKAQKAPKAEAKKPAAKAEAKKPEAKVEAKKPAQKKTCESTLPWV